jgi:hypothetical protein
MQWLLAEPTEWFMPWLPRLLPNVLAITTHAPLQTYQPRPGAERAAGRT